MIGESPVINTRQGLKEYILRNLGSPVVNVELHNTQLEDIINTTVGEFVPYSDDGIDKKYRVLELECGKTVYTLNYNTYAVLGLYQSNYLDYSPAPSDLFSINQYMANDMMIGGLGKMDILSLELVQQQISTLGIVFGNRIEFDYNSVTKELYLHVDPGQQVGLAEKVTADGKIYVYMEYYKCINYDPSIGISNLYDVKWIQQYATALARYQWGINLMKYEGTVLPNGMTINAQGTLDLGKEEMENLMTQLREEWSEPCDFFVG